MPALSSSDLRERLRARVLGPDGQGGRAVFLTEVTSPDGTRRLDAMSMGLWESRGLRLQGYEIKMKRGDFLSEIRDGQKSAALARYCDGFWLVANRGVVLDPEELPFGWGLVVPEGEGLTVAIHALELPAADLPRALVCRLLKRLAAERLNDEVAIQLEAKERRYG